eukprot:CAMPEP_0184385446 /NCGR_PEP_ID=MMETSP0007-20130409/8853_1 /TAXON_ID=97485 /ORGANISM="Prymnesium parvum, Strain Texoma1" /LENGTH=86 /DNA_ID=CAMNT_0026732815 /DNA_START=103 /DNA_END=363 /DNA_ORIENTATION=-
MTSIIRDELSPSTSTALSTEYSKTTVAELDTMHEREEVHAKMTNRNTTLGTEPDNEISASASRLEMCVFFSAEPRPNEAAMVISTR